MKREPGSHPPTLLTLARRVLAREVVPLRGALFLVGVSGGRDSMALLDVLAKLGARHGFRVVGHGVDHGLRADAARELDLAARHAKGLGVAFDVTRVSVGAGGNLQARARVARYEALERARLATGAAWLTTAHHADDRAETFLLRLLRGASADGLAVLPARDGVRLRPFIEARRSAIDLHVARHGVPFADDPSNHAPRFMRTRIRKTLMPLLTELDPSVVEHLCGVAEDLWHARGERAGGLPRATREAIEALARAGRGASVALPGGRRVVVEASGSDEGRDRRVKKR